MKRLLLAPFIFVLFLTACSVAQPELETGAVSTSEEPVVPDEAPETVTPLPTMPPTLQPATAVPTAAAADDTPAAAEPATLPPPPSPTAAVEPPQVISGQTAEGAFFLGDPAAPVTIIDYSDFL